MIKFLKNIFKFKDEGEAYLNESVNLFMLERRIKEIDMGVAPYQLKYKRLYTFGY